ncbi:hypothetical protein COB57_03800 [Candidatus Peregrinibacteria bacterium]|nr:MAG: hypothetical protein COB57_03800 [Candidatus Peregrinibacteria bacterium]
MPLNQITSQDSVENQFIAGEVLKNFTDVADIRIETKKEVETLVALNGHELFDKMYHSQGVTEGKDKNGRVWRHCFSMRDPSLSKAREISDNITILCTILSSKYNVKITKYIVKKIIESVKNEEENILIYNAQRDSAGKDPSRRNIFLARDLVTVTASPQESEVSTNLFHLQEKFQFSQAENKILSNLDNGLIDVKGDYKTFNSLLGKYNNFVKEEKDLLQSTATGLKESVKNKMLYISEVSSKKSYNVYGNVSKVSDDMVSSLDKDQYDVKRINGKYCIKKSEKNNGTGPIYYDEFGKMRQLSSDVFMKNMNNKEKIILKNDKITLHIKEVSDEVELRASGDLTIGSAHGKYMAGNIVVIGVLGATEVESQEKILIQKSVQNGTKIKSYDIEMKPLDDTVLLIQPGKDNESQSAEGGTIETQKMLFVMEGRKIDLKNVKVVGDIKIILSDEDFKQKALLENTKKALLMNEKNEVDKIRKLGSKENLIEDLRISHRKDIKNGFKSKMFEYYQDYNNAKKADKTKKFQEIEEIYSVVQGKLNPDKGRQFLRIIKNLRTRENKSSTKLKKIQQQINIIDSALVKNKCYAINFSGELKGRVSVVMKQQKAGQNIAIEKEIAFIQGKGEVINKQWKWTPEELAKKLAQKK